MLLRFLKWLMVALIAAAIVLALDRAIRPEASVESRVPTACPGCYQNAVIAAIPCAPARQASEISASVMPPMA
jgi:hypothetical protein